MYDLEQILHPDLWSFVQYIKMCNVAEAQDWETLIIQYTVYKKMFKKTKTKKTTFSFVEEK